MSRIFRGKKPLRNYCNNIDQKKQEEHLSGLYTPPLPLQLCSTSHSGKDNLLKILQRGSCRPSLELWLPLVVAGKDCQGVLLSRTAGPQCVLLLRSLHCWWHLGLVLVVHPTLALMSTLVPAFLYYKYWSSQPARTEMWGRFNKNNRFSGSLE